MSFLSRFTSKSSRDKVPTLSSTRPKPPPAPLIPLSLPHASLLSETTAAAPLFHQRANEEDDSSSLRSVDTTPWVELSNDSPRTTRTSTRVGGEGGERAGTGATPRREKLFVDPKREERDWRRTEKARLGVGEVTLVVEECGAVIRSRGLTTLGLFRPFRLAESRTAQLKLLLLFLDYTAGFDPSRAAHPTSEASKAVLLHSWREELRYAEVVDVVAVIKWAFRHLTYPPSVSFSGASPPLSFYRTYLPHALSSPRSFTTHLLPLLPPSSARLLTSLLPLLQHISAFSSRNAMPARRLCRLLGGYLFGVGLGASAGEETWEESYDAWREAGEALEGCLKASLREQNDLPPRLQDLLLDYPAFIARQRSSLPDTTRQITVLYLSLATHREDWPRSGEVEVNDQLTGLGQSVAEGVRPGKGPPKRRSPMEVLRAGLEAAREVGEADEAGRACRVVVQSVEGAAEGGRGLLERVIDEETVRVLALLGLDKEVGSTAGGAAGGEEGSGTVRRRMSIDQPNFLAFDPSPSSPYRSTIGARSAGNLLSSTSPSSNNANKHNVTPSWNDFASTGFASRTSSSPGGAAAPTSDEFGLFSPSVLSSRAVPLPSSSLPRKQPIVTKLVSLTIHQIDEEFADVWLDSLSESRSALSPMAGWRGMVVAPLAREAVAGIEELQLPGVKVDHLLVVEQLLPPLSSSLPSPGLAPPAGLNRALSSASTTRPSLSSPSSSSKPKWRRRASAIFSSSSTNASSVSLHNSAPSPPLLQRNPSSDGGSVFATLLPSARRSRKSFAHDPSTAPPVPALPTLPSVPATPEERTVGLPPVVPPKQEEEAKATGGAAGLARKVSQRLSKRTSRASLVSAASSNGGVGAGRVPQIAEEQKEADERPSSAVYRLSVPLFPAAASDGDSARDAQKRTGEVEQEEAVGYKVENSPEVPRKETFESPAVPEKEKAEVEESPAVPEKEVEVMEEEEKVGNGLKPMPSPFDAESPMDPSTPLPQSTTSTGSALPSSPSSTAADGFPLPSFLSNAPSTSHLAAPVPAPTLERTTSDILASQGEELVLHPETALAPAGVEPHPEPVSEVEHGAVESTRNGEGEVESVPSTPTFTLSEPTSERTEVVEREEEHLDGGRSEKRFSNETVRMAKEHDEEAAEVAHENGRDLPALPTNDNGDSHSNTAVVGLGLTDAPASPASCVLAAKEAPPATPRKHTLPTSSPETPRSPTLSVLDTPMHRSFSASSPPPPKSPALSTGSTSSTSRKFLGQVGGFLRRKKSSNLGTPTSRAEKEAALRATEEAKQLRKVQEEELRREVKARKAATPVSSVKKRVKEIEEEAKAEAEAGTEGAPATPQRGRTTSGGSKQGSPRPASPTPQRSASALGHSIAMDEADEAKAVEENVPEPASKDRAMVASGLPFLGAAAAGVGAAAVAAGGVVAVAYGQDEVEGEQKEVVEEGVEEQPLSEEMHVEEPNAPAVLLEAPSQPDEDALTGPIPPQAIDTPAQESQHLFVKLPSSLDNLPSPIPSPSPQASFGSYESAQLASDDDTTQTFPDLSPPVFLVQQPDSDATPQLDLSTAYDGDEDHTGPIPDIAMVSPAPAQESEHLLVKIPASHEDLASPLPSPTPLGGGGAYEPEPLAEDLTETIPEISPPVFVASEEGSNGAVEGLQLPVHTRDESSATLHQQSTAEPSEDVFAVAAAADEPVDTPSSTSTVEYSLSAPPSVDEREEVLQPLDQEGEVDSSSATLDRDLPSTPLKPSSSAPVDGTPLSNGSAALSHSTPVASLTQSEQDDVFTYSSSPPSTGAAVGSTPTRPNPYTQVVRASPSNYSISTTTSFQTAGSAATSAASSTDQFEDF